MNIRPTLSGKLLSADLFLNGKIYHFSSFLLCTAVLKCLSQNTGIHPTLTNIFLSHEKK